MVFVEKDSFRNLRRPPTDAFRSIPRLRGTLPVAASDLVAWYPFREGTGEDLTAGDSRFGDTTDYSATVNGATYKPSGGVTDIKTGANSGAFDLDGTDDTLDLGTVADSDQSLTFMTWVKPDTVSKSNMRFITKADGSASTAPGSVIIFLSNPPKPGLIVSGTSVASVSSSVSMSNGKYTHLAGRYDFQNGTATLFQNGQPVGNISPGKTPALSGQPWRIGDDNPSGTFDEALDGTVDGTRIYTKSLSDSEINQIYLNTKP